MNWTKIEGFTRELGKPIGWDDKTQGECGTLPVRDVRDAPDKIPRMESAWLPTPEELALLNAGKPLILSIYGYSHPPVALYVDP